MSTMASAPASYYYLDDDRVVQGPFTSAELIEWAHAGFFTNETLIQPEEEGREKDLTKEEEKQRFKPFSHYIKIDAPNQATTDATKPAQPSESESQAASTLADVEPAKSTTQVPHQQQQQQQPPPPPPRPSPPPAPVAPSSAIESPATTDSIPIAATPSSEPISNTAVPSSAASKESLWYYLDDSGNEQGPFPASDMRSWFDAGYFTSSTKVRTENETEFGPFDQRTKDQETFKAETSAAPTATTTAADKSSVNIEDEFEVDMDDIHQEEDENEDDEDEDDAMSKDDDDVKKNTDGDADMKDAIVSKAPSLPPPAKQHWFYTDTDGIIRGPFTGVTMLRWHRKGFFAFNDTPVRRSDETEAVPLSQRTEAPSFYLALPQKRILEDRWYYLDLADKEHGPFTGQQMRGWVEGGYLKASLRCRQVGEDEGEWKTIEERGEKCLFMKAPLPPPPPSAPAPIQQQPQPYAPYPQQPYPLPYQQPPYGAYPPRPHQYPPQPGYVNEPYRPRFPSDRPPPRDYAQSAGVSSRYGRGGGRIVAGGRDGFSQPPSVDRDLRQMNHYMNTSELDKWQTEMNRRQQEKLKNAGGSGYNRASRGGR